MVTGITLSLAVIAVQNRGEKLSVAKAARISAVRCRCLAADTLYLSADAKSLAEKKCLRQRSVKLSAGKST